MGTKKAKYQWVPESMRHYTPLYTGRRFWIFLNDKENPFEDWTEDSDIILYDIRFGGVLAVGKYKNDGRIEGCYMGGQGVTFEVSEPKDMIGECLGIEKWYY